MEKVFTVAKIRIKQRGGGGDGEPLVNRNIEIIHVLEIMKVIGNQELYVKKC